jgi:hypothetical protein
LYFVHPWFFLSDRNPNPGFRNMAKMSAWSFIWRRSWTDSSIVCRIFAFRCLFLSILFLPLSTLNPCPASKGKPNPREDLVLCELEELEKVSPFDAKIFRILKVLEELLFPSSYLLEIKQDFLRVTHTVRWEESPRKWCSDFTASLKKTNDLLKALNLHGFLFQSDIYPFRSILFKVFFSK